MFCCRAAVNNILVTLGNAFSATALFLLGLKMVGRVKEGEATSGSSVWSSLMIVPIVLVLIKIVLLPMIARETVSLLKVNACSVFGFPS